MTEFPLNARSLSFRWDGNDYTLLVDETDLIIKWSSPAHARTVKFPLRELRRDLPVERWITPHGRKRHLMGIFMVVSACVVYFSDIPEHVPLLAPVLVILGTTYLYLGFRAMLPLTKTTIRTKNGSYVTGIPHLHEIREKRIAFETVVAQMIRHARQDEPEVR